MAFQFHIQNVALFVVYLAISVGAVYRNLLFLERGSGHTIDGLWNQLAFNDAHGNKSLAMFGELKAGGTFKAYIDPLWGDATTVEISYLNEYGTPLQFLVLNVVGLEIGVLSEWFQTSAFVTSGEPVGSNVQLQSKNGNNELIVKSSTTGSIRAIVYNDHPTVAPTIMLAVNSSTTMAATAATSTSIGCFADWEMTYTLSFTDAVGITVAGCLASCTTSYSAVRTADRCYCVEFKTQIHNLPIYCDKFCPGDGKSCGGVSDGYFSVYSGSGTEQNNLNTLSVSQEILLTLNHSGGSQYLINIADVLTAQGWIDKTLYFNGIAVDATNSSDHRIHYVIEFSQNLNNYTQFQNGTKFVTDGAIVNTGTQLVDAVKIAYDDFVTSSTIIFYGPPANSFIDVPYLRIRADFSGTSTTTAAASSSTVSPPSTTVTGSPSSSTVTAYSPSTATANSPSTSSTMSIPVSELYNVFPNMSLLINGTLYCPCNETNITTFYPELTSIYENMTLEESLADLAVDPDEMTANTRKYVSAEDDRPSAQTMGVLGIVLIVSMLSFIVYLDSTTLVVHGKMMKKNIKILRKQCSTKTKVHSINIKNDPPDPDEIPIPDILK